jgi:hypothetical protein
MKEEKSGVEDDLDALLKSKVILFIEYSIHPMDSSRLFGYPHNGLRQFVMQRSFARA